MDSLPAEPPGKPLNSGKVLLIPGSNEKHLNSAYYVPNTVKLVSFPHPALLHNIVQNVRCTNLRVAFPIMNTPIIVHILIYAALHTHSAPRIRSVF